MAGEALPRRQAEIGGDELVGVLQQLAPPYHGAAAADGYRHPLMRVDGDGVGLVQAGIALRKARVERSEPAVGTVHVQPEGLLAAEPGEVAERVYGSRLHASSVRRDEEGAVTCAAVSLDRRAQVGKVHSEVAVNGHLAGPAEPEREGGFVQAGMPLRRHVHGKPGVPLETFVPDIPPVNLSAPVARNLHAVPVCVRATAEENTVAPVAGKADELHEPADSQLFQVYGRVFSAGTAGVRRRCGEGRQHAQLGCRRVYEGGEAGVILAAAIGQHPLDEEFQDLIGLDSLSGERHFLDLPSHLSGERPVHRILRQCLKVGPQSVHELVTEVAEGRAVHREWRRNLAVGLGLTYRCGHSHPQNPLRW